MLDHIFEYLPTSQPHFAEDQGPVFITIKDCGVLDRKQVAVRVFLGLRGLAQDGSTVGVWRDCPGSDPSSTT